MKLTKNKIIIIVLLILVGWLILSSMFIVNQEQQAVVLRFGQIRKVVTKPGINFKTPFVDNVVKFEKRLMLYDIEPERIITADKKTIVVDTYAIWRINDPKTFMESMRSVQLALTRIDDVVYSNVRDLVAKYTFEEVLSKKREEMLKEITERSSHNLKDFGIEIVDVRVKRTDLPPDISKAVYNRMMAERYSIAAQIRAEGQRESEIIKAEADKKVKIIISEAKKNAEVIKGTADASVITIYADAYNQSPEFFELRRLADIYNSSMDNNILLLSPDSPILKFLYEEK
ncbi:membrane protein [Marinitoga sp. 1135]|uniref:Protein HflC n=1 Tax=Marinitoga piezophila (strain DSM 14283 / JCM 11233 / KA3) TaxID=443254 RepID=H2J2Y9_MARPK|nr:MULTISPECIES: protease modulator HflC [Marinitoga]AEX85680.1 membrane protease subunit, stomatin/prohibitin [Marinitoga piezophila KA3]NUU95885.1 membrane protein [Marinitoga sp. 1135]NUU97795.1 membrane protein [Marinitoga sp. 1138]